MPKSYVYCLPEIDFPRGLYTRLHSALALLTGNRLLPHTVYKGGKKLNADGGLPLVFYYTAFCRFVKQIGNKSPARKAPGFAI